jgi:hypothetical protein
MALQVQNVLLQTIDLLVSLLELGQQLQHSLVSLISLLFLLQEVVASCLQFLLHELLLLLEVGNKLIQSLNFFLGGLSAFEESIELGNLGLEV